MGSHQIPAARGLWAGQTSPLRGWDGRTFGPISPLRFSVLSDLKVNPRSPGPSFAQPKILWRASATDKEASLLNGVKAGSEGSALRVQSCAHLLSPPPKPARLHMRHGGLVRVCPGPRVRPECWAKCWVGFAVLRAKAALATNLLGIVAYLDVLHRQSVAILVAGSPHHNATRSSGCHAKYFNLWPATHRVIDLP